MEKQPKSVRRIVNAFLEMRASRPLEKIMVTELCEKADVHKSTFYAYYRDIYDLSDHLEEDVLQRILDSLPDAEMIHTDPALFTRHLLHAYQANRPLISILFADSRMSLLPEKIERSIKQLYYSLYPEARNDAATDVILTYKIYGACYAFFRNDANESLKIDTVCELTSPV